MNGKKVKTLRVFSLLFVICSLIACSHDSLPDDFPALPPGMGSFSLSVSASRTILPDAPALSHFNKLELVFTATGGGAVSYTETIVGYSGSSALPAVLLLPGEYSLTVNAYKATSPDVMALAARGTLSPVDIIEGENTPGAVTLKMLLSEPDTTGTFLWNITVPGTVNTATAKMTITPLATGGTIEQVVSLTSLSGSLPLNSGPYSVVFYFEDGNKKLKWSEYVHVYSTLETGFVKTFTADHFNIASYTVTYVTNNGTAVAPQSVLHGETLTPPADITKTSIAYLHLGTPAAPGFVFGGWYTDDTFASNSAWDSSAQVIGDATLYAKWTGAIDVSGSGTPTQNAVEKAIEYVKANAAAGDEYTLFLDADVSVAPQFIDNSINNFNLTIQGLGGIERKINLSAAGKLFDIGGYNKLTLGSNITLKGRENNTEMLVYINEYATFTMLPGSKITGNETATTSAVWLSTGSFIMEGGTITGNSTSIGNNDYTANAVFIEGGTFEMRGGSIKDNDTVYGDVSGCSSDSITLSGDARIGEYTHPEPSTSSNIENGWTGSITSLNLISHATTSYPKSMTDAISEREGTLLFQGGGVNSTSIGRIGLGDFILYDSSGSTVNVERQAIGAWHYIADSGSDIGKLMRWNLQTEVDKYETTAEDEMIITVPGNLILTANINVPAPAVNTNAILKIISDGSPYTISRGAADTTADNGLFMVSNGAKLVFENIIVDGKKIDYSSSNRAPLVRVETGGGFTMNAGAVLQNNRAANGGGVYVIGGTFTLDGGEITGCEVNPPGSSAGTGNGVYVNGGTFTMNKGDISGNTGDFCVYIANGGAFEMKDGNVSGNNQSYTNGVNVANGEFIMRGGTIKDNSSLAVRASYPQSFFTMHGGEIKDNQGGGVVVGNSGGGTFIMDGGAIFDNTHTASSSYGAGVQIYYGGTSFTVGGTAKIYGNQLLLNNGTTPTLANVYLPYETPESKFITLGTVANGASAPEDGMNVYVKTAADHSGVIVESGASAAIAEYFHADEDDAKEVVFAQNSGNEQLVIQFKSVFTTITGVQTFLAAQTGGATASDPINLSVAIALGRDTGGSWQQLLEVIAGADKFINLDLSACTMFINAGGIIQTTSFDPVRTITTGKDKIVSIALPDTATYITPGAVVSGTPTGSFQHFNALTSFSGANLETIGEYAFRGCGNLTMTSLPSGLTSIGNYAFGNTSLALTSLPSGLTSIGNYAFQNTNVALTSLPAGITSISEGVFANCTSLTQINLSGITSIGSQAFRECTNLAQITLPEGLISIDGNQNFLNCTSLTQITLPSTLASLGDGAFSGCTGLALVTSLAATPPVLGGNFVFNNTPASLQIEVPTSSVADYQGAAGWDAHAGKIIAITP